MKCLSETRGSSSDVADLRFLGFHPDTSRRSHTNAGPWTFRGVYAVYKIIGLYCLITEATGCENSPKVFFIGRGAPTGVKSASAVSTVLFLDFILFVSNAFLAINIKD